MYIYRLEESAPLTITPLSNYIPQILEWITTDRGVN